MPFPARISSIVQLYQPILLTHLPPPPFFPRKQKRENTVLRISEDPGRYLCDFIYFSSLAHLWKQGKPRDVLFLHVPAVADDATLAYGRELVLQLIRAIVEVHLTGHQQQQQQQ